MADVTAPLDLGSLVVYKNTTPEVIAVGKRGFEATTSIGI